MCLARSYCIYIEERPQLTWLELLDRRLQGRWDENRPAACGFGGRGAPSRLVSCRLMLAIFQRPLSVAVSCGLSASPGVAVRNAVKAELHLSTVRTRFRTVFLRRAVPSRCRMRRILCGQADSGRLHLEEPRLALDAVGRTRFCVVHKWGRYGRSVARKNRQPGRLGKCQRCDKAKFLYSPARAATSITRSRTSSSVPFLRHSLYAAPQQSRKCGRRPSKVAEVVWR